MISQVKEKFISVGWLLTVVLLFLYSFTQIDLGLTLTRFSPWQVVQKNFQSLGYFNRPLSFWLYLGIIFLLFAFYFLIIGAVKKRALDQPKVWKIILVTAGILWFSYNAFSYDLFNYIFDARIVTYYHQNPYFHKALDFPGDSMLGFMHWTHRLYPYGPLWIVFSIPLSFLSFQKLLLNMVLFKGLAVLSYVVSCRYLYKILKKIKPQFSLTGLVIFAFNPLVIIESLVSGHNDIVMMAFILAAIWYLTEKRYWRAWLFFIVSIGLKYATGILLPIFLWFTFFPKTKLSWDKAMLVSGLLMIVPFIWVIRRTELQPWYLLFLLPFAGLLPEKKWYFWPTACLSCGLLLHYAPFLLMGNWNPPIPTIRQNLSLISLFIGVMIYFLSRLRRNENNSQI